MANNTAGWLLLHIDGYEPKSYELHEGKNRIGRVSSQSTPDVGVDGDKLMSRNHAVLVVRVNERNVYEYLIADNAAVQGKPSLNGTYVNGSADRIGDQPVMLRDGDTFRCGESVFELRTAQFQVDVEGGVHLRQRVSDEGAASSNPTSSITLKKRITVLLIMLMCACQALAQQDIVSGNAKSYAGDTLNMYAIDDYVTRHETLISQAVVDKDGNFRFDVKVREVTMAYIDLCVFKCMLYLQPNTRQTIILPIKQNILPDDEINPFFRKTEFYAKLVDPNPNDLNWVIPRFDGAYNKALNHFLMSPYGISKAHADSVQADISQKFVVSDKFFQDYKKYRFAMLDYTAYHRNKEKIIEEFFSGKDVLYKNPAYNDLYDEMFTNGFFNMKALFVNPREKFMAMHDRSYSSLRKSLTSEAKINSDMLADYFILKGLKDAYYSDTFPKGTLVALADSMALQSKTREFRTVAAQLSEQFTTLLKDWPAPALNLSDKDGKLYNLESFAGKFTYMVFFNPQSYASNNSLELMEGVRKDISPQLLNVIIVFVSNSKNDYLEFLSDNPELGVPVYWYNGDSEMLRKYSVRAYPTYYLLSPEGAVQMAPAVSPTEYFTDIFQKISTSWRQEQIRKQYRNNANHGLQGIR